MRVTLIHNPGAGSASGMKRHLIAMISDAGHKVRYCSSKHGSWKAALDWNSDLIAVAGGDGTVGRVARRLINRDVPLAIIPLGTANNLSHSTRNWGVSVSNQIERWTHPKFMNLDAVLAQGPWGQRYFVEGAGLGLFAHAMARAEQNPGLRKLKTPSQKLDYAIQWIAELSKTHPTREIHATLDGKDISGKYMLFEAMNIRHVGPNLPLALRARANDGLMDIIMVGESDRTKLRRHLDPHQRSHGTGIHTVRGKILHLEWRKGHLHLDDKSVTYPGRGKREVLLSMLPAALKVLVTRRT